MSDPEFCVRAGYHVLTEKMNDPRAKGSIDRALCLYGGQVTALKTYDWCWAMDEYRYMVHIINKGPVLLDTNNDRKSPDYATTTVKAADGTVLGKSLNCQDHTTTRLAQAFAKMEDYYKMYTSEVREKTYTTGVLSMMSRNTRPIPSTGKLWCIDDVLFYFDLVRAAMDGATVMNAILVGLLAGVLDRLCEFVIESVLTVANNFLNSVCLPLPDFSFSISGPNLKKTGCNGISLGQALAVNGSTLTPEQVKAGMHEMYEGIPGINSLPSFSWGSPSLAGPLRAIFGSTTVNAPSGQ